MIKFDNEELEVLDYFEKRKSISSNQNFDIEKYKKIAKNTIEKKAKISIRLNEKDLRKLKAKSIELGIPYQALINIIIHQYTEGSIKLKL